MFNDCPWQTFAVLAKAVFYPSRITFICYRYAVGFSVIKLSTAVYFIFS
jgi:hypothetical protein